MLWISSNKHEEQISLLKINIVRYANFVSCISGNPAYGGSPPTCHKARGVNLPYLDTRHPETDIWQKNSPKCMEFSVGFQPYANHDIYHASVMVEVCTGKVEEEPEYRQTKRR